MKLLHNTMKNLLILISLVLMPLAYTSNSTLQLFKPSKELRIGAFNSPPIIILEEGEAPKGFMVDYLEAVAEEENWQITWVPDSWNGLLERVKVGNIDLLPFVAFKEERTEFIDYSSENFMTGWGQVYASRKDAFQSVMDLENKDVAVLKNEIHGLAFVELCETFGVNCNIKEVINFDIAFRLLQDNKVDGVVAGNWVGHDYLERFDIAPTSIIYNPKKTLFGVPKGTNADLIKTIDSYIVNWRNDKSSAYYSAHKKWLDVHHTSNLSSWMTSIIFVSIGLLFASIFIAYILRQQVKKQTDSLKRQSEQTRQIIDLIPHFIYAANDKDEIFLMNKYATEFCGVNPQNYETLPKKDLLEKYQVTAALFGGDQALLNEASQSYQSEIKTRSAAGEETYFNLIKVPFVSSSTDSNSVVGVAVDVTASKQYEKQIEHMSYHDPLTQLPNRILLNDRLKQSLALAVRQGYSGAILLIDLDDFKTFNHKHGVKLGDQLLKQIADRISGLIKVGDTLARLNSDTFVVQLNELSIKPHEAHDTAFKVANKVQEVIGTPINIDGSSLYISASIGVVIYPFDGKHVGNIIPRAEAAMLQAKLSKNDSIVRFTSEMETAVFHKHLINNELQNAINNHEFELFYQPQFSHEGVSPIGFEVLIRWTHNKHGVIYPSDFIPAAEENNLIISIGYWVIEQAFKDLQKLQTTSLKDVFLGINLSVVQIKDPKLVPLIKKLLKQYKVTAESIEFEITETVIFGDIDDSIKTLNEIKKLGCKISIDDFGTGYSSLSYLNQLPLDKLKIDRSFIKDIEKDKGSQAIVKTIVNMAKDLGLTVLAEGIEEESQLEYLRSIDCQYYQGYHFNKAISFSEMLADYDTHSLPKSIKTVDINKPA